MLVDSSSLHFDAIQKIELQREGKHFVFEKDNGIWQQVSPFTIQMDSASMIALVNTVQGVQVLGQLKGEA
jgi:hypothetical protein